MDPIEPQDPTDALSAIPAAGGRRATPALGTLRFFYGPMDCGKSTLALQIDHNQSRQGRCGLLLVRRDRSARPQITSRIGITRHAVELAGDTDVRELVRAHWAAGHRVDYLIVDEAQFLEPQQVDQLAELADDVQLDVYCFGIAIDFRSKLFPGSARLFELADTLQAVQVEVLCWCGLPGRFNARVAAGRVVREGGTVLVADTTSASDENQISAAEPATESSAFVSDSTEHVRYQVLCRRHFRLGDLGPLAAPAGQLRFA